MSNLLSVKYALVFNSIVQSTFYSDKPKSEFPDIESYLIEIPEEVQCNWTYKNGEFTTNIVLIEEEE